MRATSASSTVARSRRLPSCSRRGTLTPKACRVALDQFAERVARSPPRMWLPDARPFVLRGKQPLIGGPSIVELAWTISNGDQTASPSIRLRPSTHSIGACDIEPAVRDARQSINIGGLRILRRRSAKLAKRSGSCTCSACHVSIASMSRRLWPRRCRSLAMEHSARPRVGAANHDDRNARPVEPGKIGDPSDAELAASGMTLAIVSQGIDPGECRPGTPSNPLRRRQIRASAPCKSNYPTPHSSGCVSAGVGRQQLNGMSHWLRFIRTKCKRTVASIVKALRLI